MTNCIFCKIINNEIPGKIIYEDDICLAFLDISQTTKGHTLVIPKTHTANFLTVDPNVLAHISGVCQTIGQSMVEKLEAKGCHILTNAGVVAGQTVMHFHMHIIPRYDDTDTINIDFTDNSQTINIETVFATIQ